MKFKGKMLFYFWKVISKLKYFLENIQISEPKFINDLKLVYFACRELKQKKMSKNFDFEQLNLFLPSQIL